MRRRLSHPGRSEARAEARGTSAAGTPPLLAVDNVFVSYANRARSGATLAVAGVSLAIRPGECLGLVGESGSGKTSLAHCICGLLAPSDGTVSFEGQVVSGVGAVAPVPRVQGVQIVFQDPGSSLNPRRTVDSLLAEVLRVHRLCPESEVEDHVDGLLGQVGLNRDLRGRRPGTLSGGQQQRVAIARALAVSPKLMIADEAVSSLDASVQAQILNLLADLRAQRGLSIAFVTHDMGVAHQLCDRIAVMKEGVIVEEGGIERVFASPQHPYTETLINAARRLSALAS
jgi:peptide/nickel transport system ATP-binding protein/oligopeptide transport system ATP-binding protein